MFKSHNKWRFLQLFSALTVFSIIQIAVAFKVIVNQSINAKFFQ